MAALHALDPTPIEAALTTVAGNRMGVVGLLDRYADRLARALASVINLIDPDAIVLGGGLSALAFLYDEVPRRWGRHILSDRIVTRLVPPAHGDSSGVRGAAWLWPPDERR